MPAARQPNSTGQCTATQRASARSCCQARKRATRSASDRSMARSGSRSCGTLASSQVRSSLRKASNSAADIEQWLSAAEVSRPGIDLPRPCGTMRRERGPAGWCCYVLPARMQFLSQIVRIVLIDLALSGDNAIVIGMAAHRLPPRQRRIAIVTGGAAAIVLRIALTAVAALLLRVKGLHLV